jgi:hypothetical protein
MSLTALYKGHDIRTPQGKRIFKAALNEASSLAARRDKADDQKEWKRLDSLRIEAYNEGLRKALALNPEPRKFKKKRTSNHRRR